MESISERASFHCELKNRTLDGVEVPVHEIVILIMGF